MISRHKQNIKGGITKLTTNEGEGHKNATKPCGGIK